MWTSGIRFHSLTAETIDLCSNGKTILCVIHAAVTRTQPQHTLPFYPIFPFGNNQQVKAIMLFSVDKSFPNPIMYIAHNVRIGKPKSRESDIMIIIVILSILLRYMKMFA